MASDIMTSTAPVASPGLSEAELRTWVAGETGGMITQMQQITGGNRYRSWAVDVETADGTITPLYLRYQLPRPPSAEPYTVSREAGIYRAVSGKGVNAPRLVAVHPDRHAILTERAPGRADYRRLTDAGHRVTVVQEFIAAVAKLHHLDIADMGLDAYTPAATIADYVKRELDIWRGMYEETGRTDPLIDLGLAWLYKNLPQPTDRPVLAHGDAGPGNFLFENGHMTALLDWELAHLGDPMEDLAWFSMRCVMEPVPDFAGRISEYERISGRPIDRGRVLYHRVFVSTRVVIIRHRNVTGEPGNSIVSRGLNRRLLIDALAQAIGVALPKLAPIAAPETYRTELYDGVIEDLRAKMAERSTDAVVVASAKNAAKVLKYLRENDRLGPAIEAADLDALQGLLGIRPHTVAEGQAQLVTGMSSGQFTPAQVLIYFAGCVAREAQLSAASSGGLATRTFPDLPPARAERAHS
jgi:aminoglycoside phosphotransferase (APT) family kinase protein